MNNDAAHILIELNNLFYRENGASFSQTRTSPWQGWGRCLDKALEVLESADPNGTFTVFDLACGNLRFKRFLEERLTEDGPITREPATRKSDTRESAIRQPATRPFANQPLTYYGVDNGPFPELQQPGVETIDVLGTLSEGITPELHVPPCTFSVSFGFMHHVPGQNLRKRVLQLLIDHTDPGGLIALSFWRFADDTTLREKVVESTRRAREFATRPPQGLFANDSSTDDLANTASSACPSTAESSGSKVEPPASITMHDLLTRLDFAQLDPGDYLLGWQNTPHTWRYCHSFSDTEIEELADFALGSAQFHHAESFTADGRSHALNTYLMLW